MTSGEFHSFPIDSIFVDREKRQRRSLPKIDELAESIQRTGLIHPLVVRRSGELVAGERRFEALKLLGWTHCSIQFVDELPELELHIIELEENIRRVDISWQDECLAVERYHELRAAQDPAWSTNKTAEALGLSQRAVQEKQMVAKEIISGNERVAKSPEYSTARNIVQRKVERRRAESMQALTESLAEPIAHPFLNADFNLWTREYDGPPFNVIHCDFPYGINADKHNQGAAGKLGGYADTQEVYDELLDTLDIGMHNVVAGSAHLFFWFSMTKYEYTRIRLERMGWWLNPWPLIWHKSDNTGIIPDPNRGPRQVYETCFFASRGDRKIVQAISNVAAAGVERDVHMSAKPVSVLRHFFRMAVDETSSVLDPTCGSGNAIVAALDVGAKRVAGLEINKEFYDGAVQTFTGLRAV